MTTVTMMKSGDIQQRIDEIDAKLADFATIEDRRALAALSGDPEAAKELADNKAEGLRLTEQRALLNKAMTAAQQQEEEAREVEKERQRLTHLHAARDAARAILPHAARVDEMLVEFLEITAALGKLEATIRTERHKAGLGTSGRLNTSNLQAVAVQQFGQLTAPAFERVAPMVEVMAVAFGDLLDETEEA